MQTHLLIQELGKLKETSKEAIANGNLPIDDCLKNYLHIERPVEQALKQALLKACQHHRSTLLMVCGNVGDGKSHLISRVQGLPEYQECFTQFKVHNDATVSFNPDEDCIATLSKLLIPFRDDQLGKHSTKILLAINLGTLSNFLEQNRTDFTALQRFVYAHQIIEGGSAAATEGGVSSDHFDFVNFTNYHFYSLNSVGPQMDLIEELFRRVTADSPLNPIFTAYKSMREFAWPQPCPVISNFDFLCNAAHQRVIARLLVGCLIKEKQIISFRQLLNFIYDLLVPYQLAQPNLVKYQQLVGRLTAEERLATFTPYYLFENPTRSKIFSNLYQLDPAIRRYEELDERAVQLFTDNDPCGWLNNEFPDLLPFQVQPKPEERIRHELLTKAFLRFHYIEQADSVKYTDDYFADFIQALYAYNTHDVAGLRPAIELVKKAAYSWNGGTPEKNKAIVPGTVKSTVYRLFRQIELRSVPKHAAKNHAVVVNEFGQELHFRFQVGHNSEPISIDVDYALYVLLQKINDGYRPNKIDRQTYVNFGRFVENVTFADIDRERLYIDEINYGQPVDYTFFYDDEFQEFTFKKLPRL